MLCGALGALFCHGIPPESTTLFILIDNYDSFTWNLWHFLSDLGADVEIIRNDGEEVMAKLMREGEIYVVDSRDRLYLSTGNAGGVELVFHDGAVQSVGESGEILRDLPLDADRLRNQL